MSDESFTSNPYKKDEKKTLGEVIVAQIDMCRKEFSKELRKGFEQQQVIEGKIITVSVPDQRQTNIECTKTLHDLMMFFFDDKINKRLEEINKNLDSLNKIYLDRYLKSEMNARIKKMAMLTNTIQNSPVGERVFQQLMNHRSNLHRQIFQEIVLLFKRKNELSGKRILSWKD